MNSELAQLEERLRTYIEATYHLSDPQAGSAPQRLLSTRRDRSNHALSTPRYSGSRHFRDLSAVLQPGDSLDHLGSEAGGRRVFDPPYAHQAEALELVLGPDRRDVVVTTGTGSGKTRPSSCPCWGAWREAAQHPARFSQRGVRALLLYPMNALVNDPSSAGSGSLFRAPELRSWFTEHAGRPVKFARYTGRTLYPGVRTTDRDRHSKRLSPLRFYTDLENLAAGGGTPEERDKAA